MTRRRHLALTAALLVAALVAPVALPGSVVTPAGAAPPPAVDPGIAGSRPVEELSYDLGDEAFAPEGLGARVELRGKVYAPSDGADSAPLVVIMHGRHATCGGAEPGDISGDWPCPEGIPEIPSYRGYDALGRNLASQGNVVVSIGANGINANDGFVEDGGATARAHLIMETLRRWQAWSTSPTGSPFGTRFVGRVDMDRVALMGHSRGGEGVVAAAALNQGTGSPFGIRAVLALAPVDFGRRVLTGIPLGVILPDCDGDVSDLQGADYFDDARYAAPGDPASRSVFHMRGANHNFFNTVWTTGPGSGDDSDWSERPGCRSGGPGRLTATQQNSAGAALMAGYLRRYLTDEVGLQRLVTGTAPFPASAGPARWTTAYWAPDRLEVERWDSGATTRRSRDGVVAPAPGGSPGVVCNPARRDGFTPSRARITVACPGVDGPGFVDDTGVLDLGWTSRGTVVRRPLAPAGVDVTGYDGVRFRAAVGPDSRNLVRPTTQDLTVVLEDASGVRRSARVRDWSPALTGPISGHPGNIVLSGVRIPLSAFSGVDLTHIRAVELRTDRTNAGRVQLADLAFTDEGTADAAAPTLAADGPALAPCRGRSAGVRYACAVGQVVYGRDLTPDEISAALPLMGSATDRKAYASWQSATPEAFSLRLLQFLQPLTQSSIDPADVSEMLSPAGRRSWEAAQAQLSAEIVFGYAGYETPGQITDALYETYTGARADAGGRSYWVGQLQAGRPPSDLARTLRRSLTARRAIVRDRYLELVGQAPDTASLDYWTGRLAVDGSEKILVVTLMGTDRFRQLALSSA